MIIKDKPNEALKYLLIQVLEILKTDKLTSNFEISTDNKNFFDFYLDKFY